MFCFNFSESKKQWINGWIALGVLDAAQSIYTDTLTVTPLIKRDIETQMAFIDGMIFHESKLSTFNSNNINISVIKPP